MNARTVTANVVLVHGGLVDGSGWRAVYDLLKRGGHNVSVAQIPTLTLKGDVLVTRQIIDAQDGPVVLVGHSYGGQVITEAGNDEKVAALVYVSAFAADKGESVGALIATFPAGGPQPPILPPKDGLVYLDRSKFHEAFAADLLAADAEFMADSQVPSGVEAFGAPITEPAWRTKPSWYFVTTEDRMIPPSVQQTMAKRAGSTVVEVKGSHASYVSHPAEVAGLIEQAATAVSAGLAAPAATARK